MRTRHLLRAGAAAVVVGLVAACATPPRPTPSPTPEAVDLRVRFAPEPAWSSDGPERLVEFADLSGDQFVFTGQLGNRLRVVDLASGTLLWELKSFSGRVGPNADARKLNAAVAVARGLVMVEYLSDCGLTRSECTGRERDHGDTRGVVALDVRTGNQAWRTALAGGAKVGSSAEYDALGIEVDVIDADDDRVIAVVRARRPAKGVPAIRTVGLRTSDGKLLWQRDDWRAVDLAGEVVVGEDVGTRPPRSEGEPLENLSGLAATSGEPLWTQRPNPDLRVRGHSRHQVLVQDERTGQATLVRTSDGNLQPLGEPLSRVECPDGDSGENLVCTLKQRSGRMHLYTVGADGAVNRSTHPVEDHSTRPAAITAYGTWLTWFPYEGATAGLPVSFTADADGTRTSEQLPGNVIVAAEGWVVTRLRGEAFRDDLLRAYRVLG